MGCKYVKEFDFGPPKVQVKGYSRGGPVKAVTPVKAVHKHEKVMHPGKPLTPFPKGKK